MAMKAAKRFSVKMDTSIYKRTARGNQENIARTHLVRDVFQRLGNINQENSVGNHKINTVVCKYWLEGRCTRNPCKFMHPDKQAKSATFKSKFAWKNPSTQKSENSPPKVLKTKENCDVNKIVTKSVLTSDVTVGQSIKKTENCMKSDNNGVIVGQSGNIKKTENCLKGDNNGVVNGPSKNVKTDCTKVENCENLQSWFCGNKLSVIAQLGGHKEAVTGIVYPNGSNKLYCGSMDKSMRVWDCNSGQCGHVENFDGECRTLVKEDPWIFGGLRNMIKGWNFETQTEVVIRAGGGHVNAITMFEDILFAGMEDGTILSWKSTSKSSFSEEATCMNGHTGSVLSLIIGNKRLYSGSADHTIRAWDCNSLECIHVLSGHKSDVTTVLCWDQYLLSGSLDKTIKVWGAAEGGNLVQVYQLDVVDAVLALCGMHGAEGKPILLCSCKDNGVYLFDLPSFVEVGRIFSKTDVRSVTVGLEGLIFTGDVSGLVTVWKPSGEPVRR
ncbi:zinc finger CCCH domain-containing protein 48-like [Rutidosis leptorrhynchoides]|uniref:zinc finger CCCH domain-containing protein 48-like n=1 Tax=Rutidosis leptorrhynchoides TaxID=125765 RepID=UPI003A997FFA